MNPGARDVTQVGHYRILEEIGRGGQAIVYLAEDERLHRRVALKVLTGLGPGSETVISRFWREAAIASKLDHPNICAVYDAGVHEGIAFIAMRYVQGRTLASEVAHARSEPATLEEASITDFDEDSPAPRPPKDRDTTTTLALRAPAGAEVVRWLEIFERAARALHAAHEAGIVHRDIKPGNVLLGPGDEPVILDFGLAGSDEGDLAGLTRSGELFGTPAYMSPEQLAGQRIALDRRTDLWSLGVSLYEALTLRRPFEAPTRQALYQTIMTKEPVPARRVNRAIDRDLDVVIATCLEKDRDRRYQTARHLADELKRVRLHEPIQARPAGPLRRSLRWAQRNPALAAATALVVLLVLVASALLAYGRGAAGKAEAEHRERRLIEKERDAAEAESRDLLQKQRDRVLVDRIEENGTALGFLVFALEEKAANASILRDYLHAFEEYGLPLNEPDTADRALAVLAGIGEGRQVVRDHLIEGFRAIQWILQDERIAPPEAQSAHATALRNANHVLGQAPLGAWSKKVRAASERYDATSESSVFLPLIRETRSGTFSARELAELAFELMGTDDLETDAAALLDRAIELEPDRFGTHAARGGLDMMASRDGTRVPVKALHHFEVLVALRPESAMAWAALGMARGIEMGADASARDRGHAERVSHAINRATDLAPRSGLIWFLKGWLLSFGPPSDECREALEKAIELEPGLQKARDLLARISGK